ncbi:hypothetical protein [Xanthomonas arboricola]
MTGFGIGDWGLAKTNNQQHDNNQTRGARNYESPIPNPDSQH